MSVSHTLFVMLSASLSVMSVCVGLVLFAHPDVCDVCHGAVYMRYLPNAYNVCL